MDSVDKDGLAGWYSNANTSSSSREILQSTYDHAKLLLRTIVKPKDFESLFPPTDNPNAQEVSRHTILDVQRYLKDTQVSYESRVGRTNDPFQAVAPTTTASSIINPTTPLSKVQVKARLWSTEVSEVLVYYGNIFDVLVQHHPEYVSLAWGTFKLLFVAIVNHAEIASKISKSISDIAQLLPQHSLHVILYPTPQMQIAVARLYAHILNFFVSSLKWYKDNRALHAIKAIFQPWELKFQREYEAITAEAQQIRRLADVALKAEVRDTRLDVAQGKRHLELVIEEMRELRAENQRLADLFRVRFGRMEHSVNSIYKEIRLDLASQRSTLNRVHLNQMLSLPLWNSFPTSGESLQFCRSMSNRRRDRAKLPLPDIQKLETWASRKSNDVLLIDTYMPAVAKSFMVDLIDLILNNRLSIIWALRYADYMDQRMSPTDVIRMLVLQAMQVGADGLLNRPFPVTVEHLREASSLRGWVAILDQMLSCIGHAFIVLDANLVAHATAHERSESLEMLDSLRLKLSGSIKIVTAISSVTRSYADELENVNACVKIQMGNAKNWRQLRRSRQPAVRFRRI